jgi:hypothetical protein
MNPVTPQNWKIWCILKDGEETEVEISRSSNVSNFKKAIKASAPINFDTFDHHRIVLTFIKGGSDTRNVGKLSEDLFSVPDDDRVLLSKFIPAIPGDEYYVIVEKLQQGMSCVSDLITVIDGINAFQLFKKSISSYHASLFPILILKLVVARQTRLHL